LRLVRFILFTLLSILLLSLFSVIAADDPSCLRTRAAFDIGSGSTKMVVAKVDICQQMILNVLLRDSRKVGYKEALAADSNNKLPSQTVTTGIKALAELKRGAQALGAKEFLGVATSAFRKAVNGALVIKKILKNTGIKVSIISQRREAILGYLAVSAIFKSVDQAKKRFVVWDIGGGSMQITTSSSADKEYLVYEGELASVSYKRRVIKDILERDPNLVESPNPIGAKGEQGITLAKEHASKMVPANIKQVIADGAQVVGIGGVHYYSIRNRIAPKHNYYTLQEAYLSSIEGMRLNDQELDSPYASTEITNLMLVSGYMLGLKVERVSVMKVNMADGVLLQKK
jgi:exopolyphosphatase / guanosine-5'-triphosphate,3'-diphosphate pyrophosphatase